MMEIGEAAQAFGALAHETRLRVFKLLIEAAPDGVPATEIANQVGVRQNLMSSHLSTLVSAGLATNRRDGRRVYYSVDLERVKKLLAFLIEDCCQDSPQACQALVDVVSTLAAKKVAKQKEAALA